MKRNVWVLTTGTERKGSDHKKKCVSLKYQDGMERSNYKNGMEEPEYRDGAKEFTTGMGQKNPNTDTEYRNPIMNI